MNIESIVQQKTQEAIQELYGQSVESGKIIIQKTRPEFKGDITVVVFPFTRFSKKSPAETGEKIGQFLKHKVTEIADVNTIKGFLNITVKSDYWIKWLENTVQADNFGIKQAGDDDETIMIEYSSPNTNKPLHLGHIRNNLLGYSLAKIFEANGKKVIKVNLVNDRGIHICKSMLAWKKWGNNETPESTGVKGDHLVGKYYVKFETEYKKQQKELIEQGNNKEYAEKNAPLLKEAQEMLRKWELEDKETVELWKKMNEWVYKGFDKTYKRMGVDFDKIYYESELYKSGKDIVLKGLEKGIFFKKDDGSIWADLSNEGLDEKLLLRSDGTSVYMTQDIGTACERFREFDINKHYYIVGNEQEYHFKVLAIILKKLGYEWAKDLIHFSYGMVNLPSGKMKSREGTVVDADDLIDEMLETARRKSQELGKLDDYSEEEAKEVYNTLAMGALKYFILKVDPKKNMLFNPEESIDFNGNTGPFIQYTYVRIQSVLRKAKTLNISYKHHIPAALNIDKRETGLIKLLYDFPNMVADAGSNGSPSIIANYVHSLAKEYNQFYHENPILKEKDKEIQNFRLNLSVTVAKTIKTAVSLLGFDVPKRM